MHDRISVNPKVCHGQACIKGTRIPVHQIIGMMANGDTIENLLRAYPAIEREDILACLKFAASRCEKKINKRKLEKWNLHESLKQAIAVSDMSGRAKALQQFVTSNDYEVYDAAFKELEKCGKAALPFLRVMMHDLSLMKHSYYFFNALAEIGYEELGDELTAIIKEELVFWKTTASELPKGWWNDYRLTNREYLRNQYGKLFDSLRALNKIRFSGSKEVVTELRDFWRSLPQLEDKHGLVQISKECDDILENLLGKKSQANRSSSSSIIMQKPRLGYRE